MEPGPRAVDKQRAKQGQQSYEGLTVGMGPGPGAVDKQRARQEDQQEF